VYFILPKPCTDAGRSALATEVEVAFIKTSLKRKAQETLEVPSTIIDGSIENSSQVAQEPLPYSQAFKNILQRKRSVLKFASLNPVNSRGLVILEVSIQCRIEELTR